MANFERKINSWTLLFQQMNKIMQEVYSVCEKENKIEFCDGIIATLQNEIQDFTKLKHRISIEKQYFKLFTQKTDLTQAISLGYLIFQPRRSIGITKLERGSLGKSI